MKIGIKSGESISFGLRLPDTYDIANLVDLTLKIGWLLLRYGNELESTADPRIFRATLNSNQTARLNGDYAIEIGITDAAFGRKIREVAQITVTQTQGLSVDAVNEGIDFLFDITELTADTITNVVQLLSALGGSQNLHVLDIMEKGEGDVITHNLNANLLIATMYDSADAMRQYNGFYNESVTLNSFVLKNDFSANKFTGKLLCVKY